VTDGNFFIAQIMFFSHKKSLNVKISNKKNSFFSSQNQYFPHIPYVASKKSTQEAIENSWFKKKTTDPVLIFSEFFSEKF
jgi:hypothetical protein